MVFDRHLRHPETFGSGQDRDEAVHVAVEAHALEHLPAIGLKTTIKIVIGRACALTNQEIEQAR